MADFFTDAYNFLQAPANARKAREAFKKETMSTAPMWPQVQMFKRPPPQLAPSSEGLPLSPFEPMPGVIWPPPGATGQIGSKMGTEPFGPPLYPPLPTGTGIPMPRRRPANAPTWMDMAAINAQAPVGANPGMGGAMFGDGVMSPQIPPQQPPADGSGTALPVWAGDQQAGGPVRGGTVQRANGTNGYVYGRSAGGPWHQQDTNRAPGIGPAQQYAVANLMGQINALNKQATATGATGVYTYKNGVKTGTVNGGSSASAYEAAAAKSRDKGTSGEGGNPSWW